MIDSQAGAYISALILIHLINSTTYSLHYRFPYYSVQPEIAFYRFPHRAMLFSHIHTYIIYVFTMMQLYRAVKPLYVLSSINAFNIDNIVLQKRLDVQE